MLMKRMKRNSERHAGQQRQVSLPYEYDSEGRHNRAPMVQDVKLVEVRPPWIDLHAVRRHGAEAAHRTTRALGRVREPLVVLAAIVAMGALIWTVPPRFIPSHGLTVKERSDLQNSSRTTFATILGGAFFLATAYLSWQSLKATREGQITSRFNDAVAHLGAESLAKRLGGIYALERIAYDSGRDHLQIMEVLTGSIRDRAAWAECPPPERVAPDLQAVITVLGRRNRRHEREAPTLDLSDTDLRKVSFEQRHLEGALFRRAHLEEAIFENAHMAHCRFDDAHLERADLSWGNLEGAGFERAHLEGAKLTRAHLQETNFRDARLDDAELVHVSLERAEMQGASLKNAYLVWANLEGASLMGADLTGATLRNANLRASDLCCVTGLTPEQIVDAVTDDRTKLPPHLR
jgi:uncharacterized protein YjbI with pentapeptide repeats